MLTDGSTEINPKGANANYSVLSTGLCLAATSATAADINVTACLTAPAASTTAGSSHTMLSTGICGIIMMRAKVAKQTALFTTCYSLLKQAPAFFPFSELSSSP
jgi:hypothetical protein